MRSLTLLLAATCLLLPTGPAFATVCEEPDAGGTVALPPACPSGYVGILSVVDGLPPGTTITGEAVLTGFYNQMSTPGGSLGGEVHTFDAWLNWSASGTGSLAGFTRSLAVPVTGVMHTGPRNPGDPVQTFAGDMFSLTGQLFGDPDFCAFTITAGTDHGLPSPGPTTLTRLPNGNFNVDSFFDITYRIDFAGCPGSILEGYAGSTTATERYQAGEEYFPPIDHNCQLSDNGTGTIDLPPECPDGYVGVLTIIDGLPAGTEITGEAVLADIHQVSRSVGGTLGGEIQIFDAIIHWNAFGTGSLLGYQRNMTIPVSCEVHTGPRTPGDPVQAFEQVLYGMNAVLYGDPDFCDFILAAGDGQGLPSPGSCTLTRLPTGDYAVDSFFDITYQLDFTGCPGSVLDGYAGSTIDTERFQAGEEYIERFGLACELPDNGFDTVDLPPECPGGYVGTLTLIDGLPAGATITGTAALNDFTSIVRSPGGHFDPNGLHVAFDAYLHWTAVGTGPLAGFARNLVIPVSVETDYDEIPAGDLIQTFAQRVMSISGQLFGDPDFCTFVVRAGHDYSLPSPGTTTLGDLGYDYYGVDSFFDITYEIEFEGCPGGALEDMAGTTQGVDRFHMGDLYTVAGAGQTPAATASLEQNQPNPFNPMTRIRYELPPGRHAVILDVFDLRGRHVRNLVDDVQDGGLRAVTWNGTDTHGQRVAAGVYFYALKTDRQTVVRKMAIIK